MLLPIVYHIYILNKLISNHMHDARVVSGDVFETGSKQSLTVSLFPISSIFYDAAKLHSAPCLFNATYPYIAREKSLINSCSFSPPICLFGLLASDELLFIIAHLPKEPGLRRHTNNGHQHKPGHNHQ